MSVKHQINVAMRTALATCMLAAGAISLPALASISGNATGGTACQASNGNGAKVFYFSNLYAQNTSAASQFLSCNFTDSEDITVTNPVAANIVVLNPTGADMSITCVVQSGTPGNGTINTQSLTQVAPAGSLTELIYSGGTMPSRSAAFHTYSVNCLMPPQAQLGLLRLLINGNFAL